MTGQMYTSRRGADKSTPEREQLRHGGASSDGGILLGDSCGPGPDHQKQVHNPGFCDPLRCYPGRRLSDINIHLCRVQPTFSINIWRVISTNGPH